MNLRWTPRGDLPMTLLKTLACASFLSTSFLVACGGSSNNPPGNSVDSGATGTSMDSGTTTMDSSTTTNMDASMGADTSTFTCTPTSGCSSTESCCLTTTGSQCIPQGQTCGGAEVTCTSTSMCTGGDVCCGTINLSSKTGGTTC